MKIYENTSEPRVRLTAAVHADAVRGGVPDGGDADLVPLAVARARGPATLVPAPHLPAGPMFVRSSRISKISKLLQLAKFCKCLAGSFSAVSKRNFARKYAFDSIFQALQDVHTSAPLRS